VDDVVLVAPSGLITVRERRRAPVSGQLTPVELSELKRLFSDWALLSMSYKSRPVAPDAFVYVIRFEAFTVQVAQSDPEIPESFRQARRRIEQLSQRIRGAIPASH
jgi:hypothetical protein